MEYSDLIRDFLDDADGHIKAFDSSLMSLEKNGLNKDIIMGVLGSLHTLKGNAGMMGYESLKNYIHQVEEILKQIGEETLELDPVLDMLLNSSNVLRNSLQAIGNDPSANPDLTEETLGIQMQLEGAAGGCGKQVVDISTYLGARTKTIKVDFKRLDDLLNLVGELVIFKTRLNQIETQLRGELTNKSLGRELNAGLELMGKTIGGLQEGIMRARMLPVSHVFGKFPRMVRDLSKSQGKEIQLFFEGEDTELDKTVIDELEEPLLHIIRNAIDHGIEVPKDRVMKGKDHKGSIVLSAAQESNFVIIRVKDDGKGINFDEVREAGVRKGLIQPDDPFDKDSILSLIFAAGFTTKEEASDISGRGIGLDVVSRNISKLNGQVIVDSSPQKGTTFTIKLPLSLAIIPALMAEAGGEVYAIPMSAVDESIKVREEDIHVINNREVIQFREKVMPVVRLDDFFGLDRKKRRRFYLIVLGKADKRLAIAVDRLRGQQEIVIKPLDDTFGKSYGIAGASILGDGRIVLIIDVMSFWNKGQALGHRGPGTATGGVDNV
ncbi:MAG: chemotaxis protein CheA [Nitrospirae bacterium]|nr:chemotaxis protein CheA [Nitrospirota bacterium]